MINHCFNGLRRFLNQFPILSASLFGLVDVDDRSSTTSSTREPNTVDDDLLSETTDSIGSSTSRPIASRPDGNNTNRAR